MEEFNGLVHPFLEELKNCTMKRMLYFDTGDLNSYMKAAHDDVHVERFVKEKLVLVADGFDDYFKKFDAIIKSRNGRGVESFHDLNEVNYTLHCNGSVTVTINFDHYEKPKNNP